MEISRASLNCETGKETTDFTILYCFKSYKLRLSREEILVTASKMMHNEPGQLTFLFLSELCLLTYSNINCDANWGWPEDYGSHIDLACLTIKEFTHHAIGGAMEIFVQWENDGSRQKSRSLEIVNNQLWPVKQTDPSQACRHDWVTRGYLDDSLMGGGVAST